MNKDMQNAFVAGFATKGVIEQTVGEFNIAYSNTAPEDTSKLWVKSSEPHSVTIDYNPENTIESVAEEPEVLPRASTIGAYGASVVGKYVYLMGAYRDFYVSKYNIETGSRTDYSVGNNVLSAACVAIGNKIYVVSANAASIYEYDTETDLMQSKASLPHIFEQTAVCAVGSKVYIFGGVHSGTRYNTILVYDSVTNTVTTLPDVALPTAASGIGCAAIGTNIYLFGGQKDGGVLDTINVFDTTTSTLTPLQSGLPILWYAPGIAVFGSKCYLIGGGTVGAVFTTIGVFDATTETFSILTDTQLSHEAGNIATAVVGNSVYLFGGWGGGAALTTISKFNITFPLNNGDIYIQEDTLLRKKFDLMSSPTKVTVGVAAVSKGNASGYAENCEAYLHDGTAWQPIT